ncbi:hypothetical protein KM043_017666 [Ampulex compressa]|nr:hypothetical protein KM043_017666 [Ampulex compressa]
MSDTDKKTKTDKSATQHSQLPQTIAQSAQHFQYAHIDQLRASSTPVERKTASLNKLLTNFKEVVKALQSLGVTQELWDYMLVHQLSRQLDRHTKEQWETSLGASTAYPRFDQLNTFLISQVRTVERIENISTHISSPVPAQPVARRFSTAHQSLPRSSQPVPVKNPSQAYLCDCCNIKYFVVMCPRFRDFSPTKR